ncbi:FmdB family zinc ribbon protein [Micrococcaceae bacterium Sec6.3]
MPTYAYRCKDCGHAFDAVQSFTDDALTECPECGGTLRKQYGSVGVSFKGSGFYRTDSRGGSAGVPASGSEGSTGGTASSGTSGSGVGDGGSSSGTPASAPKAD